MAATIRNIRSLLRSQRLQEKLGKKKPTSKHPQLGKKPNFSLARKLMDTWEL